MRVPINTENDLSMGLGTHNLWLPPIIPTPIPGPAMEMIANMKWPPGFALNLNKLTTTVKHKKQTIVQTGHDCGVMILDLLIVPPCIPIPVNAFYYIMWPLSSRKITFAASTVKANKQPVACAAITKALPMMSCGNPAALPLTAPITNGSNTVTVNMTPLDFWQGVITIALSVAIDITFFGISRFGGKVVTKVPKEIANNLVTHVIQEILKEHAKELLPEPKDANKYVAKKALKSIFGGQTSRITGDPTYKADIGTPYVGMGIEFKKDKRKGWQVKREYNILGWKWASDGSGASWGKDYGPPPEEGSKGKGGK